MDDEESSLRLLEEILVSRGRPVEVATGGARALALLSGGTPFGSAIMDLRMPDIDGLTVLRRYRGGGGRVPVIMLSGAAEANQVVLAMRAGATDYLTKPIVVSDLVAALERVSGHGAARLPAATGTPSETAGWVGESEAMRKTWEIVERVADADVPVLVQGESGVGKEVVARELHRRSRRRERPFVKINCAALPGELLESELFGHERGAFTGATAEKPGKFELADGGTLFLDEIGEMDVRLQAKLLAALQDQEFFRVGGKKSVRVNVRVVVATNRDLQAAIRQGVFREDLYYRLDVVNVKVAALRERREDIRPLVEHFIAKYAPQAAADPSRIVGARLLQRFLEHSWPGNVRELENIVRRLAVLGDEQAVLAELAAHAPALPGAPVLTAEPGLKDIGRRAALLAEREAIVEALRRTGWNKRKAAVRLQISYKALLYKIKESGIADPRQG